MRNYDDYGRLAAMEIFSHGESEARSRMGAWQDSVSPCEKTMSGRWRDG